MNTIEKLNRIADVQSYIDSIKIDYDKKRKEIMTPEIEHQLADLDAELISTLAPLQEGIDELTAAIKAEVIASGASVKGDYLQAVWSKGRVSWDNKALDGYAAGHPEIAKFRKEGDPSVSIRPIK